MPNDAIHAPWSPETVIALNQQQHGIRHRYTCPLHEPGVTASLVATSGGWICSRRPDCDYTQDWAHLVDVRFLDELRDSLDTPVDDPGPQHLAEPWRPGEVNVTLDNLAETAYEAYSRAAGGRAVNGDPLPVWDEVRPHVRNCWRISLRAVLCRLGERDQSPAIPVALPGD